MSNRYMQQLPRYYRTSRVMTDMSRSMDTELQQVQDRVDNILNQFFVDTADFTLERWEQELGIPVNNTKPADYRRSVIKSKLRGSGTVTVNFIKNVAESYSNGEVEIQEDNASYSFTVKFVGTKGIPPNLDDLKLSIEEIKPAHLAVDFAFTYTIWEEVKQMIWHEVKGVTWEKLKIVDNF